MTGLLRRFCKGVLREGVANLSHSDAAHTREQSARNGRHKIQKHAIYKGATSKVHRDNANHRQALFKQLHRVILKTRPDNHINISKQRSKRQTHRVSGDPVSLFFSAPNICCPFRHAYRPKQTYRTVNTPSRSKQLTHRIQHEATTVACDIPTRYGTSRALQHCNIATHGHLVATPHLSIVCTQYVVVLTLGRSYHTRSGYHTCYRTLYLLLRPPPPPCADALRHSQQPCPTADLRLLQLQNPGPGKRAGDDDGLDSVS